MWGSIASICSSDLQVTCSLRAPFSSRPMVNGFVTRLSFPSLPISMVSRPAFTFFSAGGGEPVPDGSCSKLRTAANWPPRALSIPPPNLLLHSEQITPCVFFLPPRAEFKICSGLVVWSSCEEQKMHVNTHPLLGPDNNGLNYEGNSPFVGGNVLGEFPLLVAAQTASILSLRPRNRIITCDLGWLENSGGRLTPEHGRRDISQSRECLAKEVDPSQRRSDTPLPTIDRNAVTLEGLNHFEQCSCQQGEL